MRADRRIRGLERLIHFATLIVALGTTACARGPLFSDFEASVGLSVLELETRFGTPTATDTIVKVADEYWFGPIEGILSLVEEGTKITTWYYDVRQGSAHVYFRDEIDAVQWVRLAPEGVVY